MCGVCGVRVSWILRGRPAPCEMQCPLRYFSQNEKSCIPHTRMHTLQYGYGTQSGIHTSKFILNNLMSPDFTKLYCHML